MEDTRTHAQHHMAASAALNRAVCHLRSAIREEDGLEWDGLLRELLAEAQKVDAGLRRYAAATEPIV